MIGDQYFRVTYEILRVTEAPKTTKGTSLYAVETQIYRYTKGVHSSPNSHREEFSKVFRKCSSQKCQNG